MRNKLLNIGQIYGWANNSISGRVYLISGIAPSLIGANKKSGYSMPYISIIYEND